MFVAYGLAGVLRKLDGFGQGVELKIDGKDRSQSLIGSFISVAMIFLALYLSLDTLMDYFNQTNPHISSSIEYSSQNLTINYTNFFFGISFYYPLKKHNIGKGGTLTKPKKMIFIAHPNLL